MKRFYIILLICLGTSLLYSNTLDTDSLHIVEDRDGSIKANGLKIIKQ
jgi:hypothetical protein